MNPGVIAKGIEVATSIAHRKEASGTPDGLHQEVIDDAAARGDTGALHVYDRIQRRQIRANVARFLTKGAKLGAVSVALYAGYNVAEDGLHGLEHTFHGIEHIGENIVNGGAHAIANAFHSTPSFEARVHTSLNDLSVINEQDLVRASGTSTSEIKGSDGLPGVGHLGFITNYALGHDLRVTQRETLKVGISNPTPDEKAFSITPIDIVTKHQKGAADKEGWKVTAKVHTEYLFSDIVNPTAGRLKDGTFDVHMGDGPGSRAIGALGAIVGAQTQGDARRTSWVTGLADVAFNANCSRTPEVKNALTQSIQNYTNGTFLQNAQNIEGRHDLSADQKKTDAGSWKFLAGLPAKDVKVVYLVNGPHDTAAQVSPNNFTIKTNTESLDSYISQAPQRLHTSIDNIQHISGSMDRQCVATSKAAGSYVKTSAQNSTAGAR